MYSYQNKPVQYLGRAALNSVPVGNAHGIGKRVVVTKYIDNGKTIVTAIKGDGRLSSFIRYGEESLSAPSDIALDAAVARMETLLK